MGRIRVLSDGLINRIAAGEVVERPASVVKELVENSLDAGAVAVEVRLRGGGKAGIEVRDDGCGMDRDDALLAIERHATSKLSAVSELETIATLGFRGEALSSIASVSRFTLETAREDGEGIRVEVEGGRVCGVSEVGHPRGTTVRVDRLFFNVPARRKFLRTDATELAHTLRWLTRYALAHPSRRFRLWHAERQLLAVDPVDALLPRVVQIYGREAAGKWLPFELQADGLAVRGFAGRPVDALPRRDAQHVFVNGRAVQDRVISSAVTQAYANTMPAGRHPAVLVFVDMDPTTVDVNVHPQKTEVRFRDTNRVHSMVRTALMDALSADEAVPALADLRGGRGDRIAAVKEATLRYLETREAAGSSPRVPREASSGARPLPEPPVTHPSLPAEDGHEARPLAQFRDSYIVAQDEEGLVLVDQHAAHERVLFERYLDDAEANRVDVQRLMFPVTLELPPEEAVLVEQDREEFERLGFRIEPFGEHTVRLEGVPAVGSTPDPAAFFRELLGEAAAARSAVSDVAAVRRRLVTTAACHAAIKIHHPLTVPAMQALLDDLYATRNPTTCPHGRPVLFRLSLEEIERTFRRR